MIRQPYGDPGEGGSGDPLGGDGNFQAAALPLSESWLPLETWHAHDPRHLRCNWDSCNFSCSISQIQDWRSHWASGGCSPANRDHSHCSFLACVGSDHQFPTLQDAITHEDFHHSIWICTSDNCDWAFKHWRTAVNHVLHHHHESWAGESSVKKMWIARRPNTEEFHRAGTLTVDLERPTAQEQPVSTVLNQDLPTSLDESIRRYITTQISSLQTFLTDPHVSLNEVSRRQLGETVETVQKSITAAITPQSTAQPTQSLFSTSPQPVGSSVQFTHPNTGPSRSRSPRIIPLSPSSRVYTDPLEPPEGIIQHRSPARESTWPHPQPRPPTEENLAVPARQHKRTPSGRAEPVQEMHLNGAKQREYFERMQECCIEAAHTFYEQHKEKLDVVTDRKGRKLCYTTHGRQIANKNDLTLPQWTHLLRRLSDAKGLKREMVSRIESFNGEIQPVDEVRHAYSKNKEKSDRDLLALVQITRCFCWQLRDWEKCEQLDDLYGTIEETIDLARRERRERSARQATWPFS